MFWGKKRNDESDERERKKEIEIQREVENTVKKEN